MAEVNPSRLERLRKLRDQLTDATKAEPAARDLAALGLRLMDVLEQIETLENGLPAEKGTALDEFTRRRIEQQAARAPRAAKRK